MFWGILPSEEAHCKPLWRVFPNGCGWAPDDTWCFFLPCRGIFVTFRGFSGTITWCLRAWKRGKNSAQENTYIETLHRARMVHGARTVRATPSKNVKLWLYITAPNCTPYIQACDEKMVNGAFKSSLEESYAEWVENNLTGEKKRNVGWSPFLRGFLQTLSCVYMPLGTWAEVKVHSYHALIHVCVGSCMCCAQATPLSKLQ